MAVQPLVSIVIPVWNRPAGLARAIDSVLAQDLAELDVVVVDNGSDDPGPVAAIVSAAGDERVRLVRSEMNLGPGGGRNLGASTSSSALIGFLDSDDEFEPSWWSTMGPLMDDPAVVVVTCGLRRVTSDGTLGEPRLPAPLGPAHGDVVGTFQAGTMLVRRALFEAVGGYDERFWFGENTDLGLRLCAEARRSGAGVRSAPVALLRWHDDGVARGYSRRKLEAAELMLDVHRAALVGDRFLRESNTAVAGVEAARLGEIRRARGHFATLLRSRPTIKSAGRYLLTWVPPVARRVWGRS